jgi:hypothetical protein
MTEKLIMRGACQLAFNDARAEEDMAKLSEEYELDFASARQKREG